MVVLDASVVVDYLLGDQDIRAAVEERMARPDGGVVAPHLIDIEVVSAFRQLVKKKEVLPDFADLALHDLKEMDLPRLPHFPLLTRIWELRDNLSAYDATYIALAEAVGGTLLTRDARMARAPGIRVRVEVI